MNAVLFDANFALADAQGTVTHTVTLTDARAESVSLETFPDDAAGNPVPAKQTLTLVAPFFTIHTAGAVVEFKSKRYLRHATK